MNRKQTKIVVLGIILWLYTMSYGTTSFAEVARDLENKQAGVSQENPIIVVEKDIMKAEKFAEDFIKDKFPSYSVVFVLMTRSITSGHAIQKYTIEKTLEGDSSKTETINLYFDMEIAMVEFRKREAKEIRERLKNIKIEQ